jgi:uncharacterized protein YutE (UPF0331/DUF86 family)
VTRDVLARKVGRLRTLLNDLTPHAGKSVEQVMADRYEIERLLELLVQVAVDLVTHELAERSLVPDSYRHAFLEAGRVGLLPEDLAGRLANAASLRNVHVHLYEDIDYDIVAVSIGRALEDFGSLVRIYGARLEEQDHGGRG